MAKTPGSKGKKLEGLILLKDLVPRTDPKGGAATKPVFGELPPLPGPPSEPGGREPEPAKPKRPKK
ncbi:MAG: hypothetical protein IT186_02975 [Acidobacteria bacterium]|nr:hypothetical protein [Acidobacteriota bacterium]